MIKEFEGVNIIVNYTTVVIDSLLKDIPKIPAVLEQPYITRGSVSPKIHIPFRFGDDVDRWYGVDPIYNSLSTELIFSSTVNKRLLNIYAANNNKELAGHKALIATDIVSDIFSGERNVVLYSLSGASNEAYPDSRPMEKNSQIMNPDETIIDLLFRKLKAFPARIHSITDPKIKPASTDYNLYFYFYNNINEVFAGKEYNFSMNNLAVNKLMHILDVETPNECEGKDIAVYVSHEPLRRKLWICGIASLDDYIIYSTKF